MLIPVMIADDDTIFIDDLVSMINWTENGFEVIATATNGKQALKLLKDCMPQVLITDIRMPVMDGLALIQEVHELDRHVRILLMSSYSEFSYAKRAIACGVTDYLLKNELDADKLVAKLQDVKAELHSDEDLHHAAMQRDVSLFFHPAENHESSQETYSTSKWQYHQPYCHVLIEEDLPLPLLRFSGDPTISLFEVMDFIRNETLPGFILQMYGSISHQRIVASYAYTAHDNSPFSPLLFAAACSHLQRSLFTRFNQSFSLFHTETPLSLNDLKAFLLSSHHLLDVVFTLETGALVPLSALPQPSLHAILPLDMNRLDELVKKCDLDGVETLLESHFKQISDSPDKSSMLTTARRIIIHLESTWEQLFPATENNQPLQNPKLFTADERRTLQITDLPLYRLSDFLQWAKSAYRNLIRQLDIARELQHSPIIRQTLAFIHRNYRSRDLSIKLIARHVALSEGRLGTLFKGETGQTLNEYLTSVRVTNACRFLLETNHKIYEIADMVGYGSSQYFSQVFLQHIGQTPNDYRKDPHS